MVISWENFFEKDPKEMTIEERIKAGMVLAKQCASLPLLDDRSPDEILGYDENGLPS